MDIDILGERNFHADKSSQKRLTDTTEFALPAVKAYLSVLVDCFNGLLTVPTISTTTHYPRFYACQHNARPGNRLFAYSIITCYGKKQNGLKSHSEI